MLTILRKTSIAFISVFLASSGAKVQAFLLLALLLGFALLTFFSRPFTSPRLNFLETLSLSVLGFSVYCSFFFLSSLSASSPDYEVGKDCKYALNLVELSYSGRWFLFFGIVLSNLVFFFVWLSFLLRSTYRTLLFKHPRIFVCLCLCGRSHRLK